MNGYPASKRLLAEIGMVASKVWSTAKSFQSFSCRFSILEASIVNNMSSAREEYSMLGGE